MKKKILSVLTALSTVLAFVGCSESKDSDSTSVSNDEFDSSMLSSEKADDFSQWEGEWESFSEYCNDDSLDAVWSGIAEKFELDTDDFKDVFRRLCFVPDDVIKFSISGNTLKGYDTENNEVFEHDYSYAATFAQDSDGTVLKGDISYVFKTDDEDAGFYKYICIMPICNMETSNGFMADHFHFSYGSSIEELTNFSNVPTMLDSSITEEQKQQSVITFFSGSSEDK